MTEQMDWLEQTWKIKSEFAEKYADKSASEQVREMRALVEREWENRGWTLAKVPATKSSV